MGHLDHFGFYSELVNGRAPLSKSKLRNMDGEKDVGGEYV